MPTAEDYLNLVRERSGGWSEVADPGKLTLGIEHELFLYRDAENLADVITEHDSQALWQNLSGIEGWKALTNRDPFFHPLIKGCSHASGLVIKYEHPPHLIELATPACSNLFELRSLLRRGIGDLEKALLQTGLDMKSEPRYRISAAHPNLVSEAPICSWLRSYRSRKAKAEGICPGMEEVNFSAGLAATQIHVGGLPWWRDDQIINNLYCFEADVVPFEYRHITEGRVPGIERHVRWTLYENGQGGELVGVPKYEKWTMQRWLQSLVSAPHLTDPPPEKPEPAFDSARDNQAIKPRMSGTIEFRSSPAQKDIQAILFLASLRLGMCAGLMLDLHPPHSYAEVVRRWWEQVRSDRNLSPDFDLIDRTRQGLRARGMKEEDFLEIL